MSNPSSPTSLESAPTSILSILISQGVLTSGQVSALPAGADNANIEYYLQSNKLVTDEQILKAYAQLFGVPFVKLSPEKIAPEIINLIPEITARRYDIVAYDLVDDILMVALSSPRRIQGGVGSQNHRLGLLQKLQHDTGHKIAPALATLADIRSAFVVYEQVKATLSVVSLVDKKLDQAVLSRIPLNAAQHYRFVAYEQTAPDQLMIAALEPNSKVTKQVIDYLEKHNRVKLTLAQTDQASLDYAFRQYVDFSSTHNNQSVNAPIITPMITPMSPVPTPTSTTVKTSAEPTRVQLDQHTPVVLQASNVVINPANIVKVTPPAPVPTPSPAVAPAPETVSAPAEESLAMVNKPVATTAQKANNQVVSTTQPKSMINSARQMVKQVFEITADQMITDAGEQESADSLVKPSVAPAGSIAALANKTDQQPAKTTSSIPVNPNSLEANASTVAELIQIIKSGNIPKMVSGIVALAIALRASDVHIEPEKDKIRLRYRIDGELEDVVLMPSLLHPPLVSRIKIMSQLKIDENRVPQDGRFGVNFKDREIDLRVSTLPTIYGEKVVVRILDKTTGIMSLEDMGIDGVNLQRLIESISRPYGIVLSTGPTGSGKSTTLYAVLQRISQPQVNVVTLEDPVEYAMVGINQVQIKPKIGFTFAEGLRSILRQDPNIIMVGEIRDKETAEMATHAALTGHLVISTLHTNTAAGALPRLINMGIEPFLITSSINAVVGQRLVRKICENCRIEEKLPEGVIEELKQDLANAPIEAKLKDPANWKFYKGQECDQCHHGYRGRVGIFEVMVMSEEIEALAVKKEPASSIEEQALKEGMMTMKQDGILKALKGLTTIEEVMKAATE